MLDNIDVIAKGDRELLFLLQRFAKWGTNSGSLGVVFVSSDPNTRFVMRHHDEWRSSRLTGAVHVGDISDAKARWYLERRGVRPPVAGERAPIS